jgi:hypothetical protein
MSHVTLMMEGHVADRLGSGRTMPDVTTWAEFISGRVYASVGQIPMVEGTWCDSHIMKPAVCILNPLYDAHAASCWRTLLSSNPIGSASPRVRARACTCMMTFSSLLLRAAPEGASLCRPTWFLSLPATPAAYWQCEISESESKDVLVSSCPFTAQ